MAPVVCQLADPTAMNRSGLPKHGSCVRSTLTLGLLVGLGSGCARLNLGVRLSDGRWLELADLRGTPVLLFVFATFDAVSQAALKSLRPFVPQHPEVVVVGIAAQPRAAQLVEAWNYATPRSRLRITARASGTIRTGTEIRR